MGSASLSAFLAWDVFEWTRPLLKGFGVTMVCAVLGYSFGVSFGFVIALAKLRPKSILAHLASVYTVLFRGVPPLLIIFLLFFGTNGLLMWIAGGFGYTEYIEIDAFSVGVLAVTLIVAAYSSEVLRGAFEAVPQGQYEASKALGLKPLAAMILVIVPQMLRLALPGLGNVWIQAIKETTLLSIIAVTELMRVVGIAGRSTAQPFAFYGIAALAYLAIVLLSNRLFRFMELKLERG